jgi:hypothetical protein
MKTAEGAVDYSAPQVRDTPEPFVSNVRAALSGRTRELERLAVELYARACRRTTSRTLSPTRPAGGFCRGRR